MAGLKIRGYDGMIELPKKDKSYHSIEGNYKKSYGIGMIWGAVIPPCLGSCFWGLPEISTCFSRVVVEFPGRLAGFVGFCIGLRIS